VKFQVLRFWYIECDMGGMGTVVADSNF
jgi:hypothetical protein